MSKAEGKLEYRIGSAIFYRALGENNQLEIDDRRKRIVDFVIDNWKLAAAN